MLKFKNNSKNIKNGDIFICTHDTYDDRHKYINDAIKNGCKAIIIDKDIKANNKMFIKVQNTNDTYYQILNNYYNHIQIHKFQKSGRKFNSLPGL